MNTANTIWVQAYTPAGHKAGITIGFTEGALPHAGDVDRLLADAGYLLTLPGLEAGEDAESILYVCREDHTDTKTGAIVPHIAFYPAVDHLVMRWVHTYLDTPEEVAEFESATGVIVADMPVYDGHPKRNDPKARNAIIKLAKPIRIVRETYTNKDGEPRHKLVRYMDSIGKPQPADPPQSGNGQADSGSQSDAWKAKFKKATEFLYTDTEGAYNAFKHDASLEKRYADTDSQYHIAPGTDYTAAIITLMKYRALQDMFIDASDYPAIFDTTIEAYVAEHRLLKTWEALQAYHVAQTQPAQPKAS